MYSLLDAGTAYLLAAPNIPNVLVNVVLLAFDLLISYMYFCLQEIYMCQNLTLDTKKDRYFTKSVAMVT